MFTLPPLALKLRVELPAGSGAGRPFPRAAPADSFPDPFRKERLVAQTVRGRFAPSPTGLAHLGNAWSFLLAWLAARQAGGEILLRMASKDLLPACKSKTCHLHKLKTCHLHMHLDNNPELY